MIKERILYCYEQKTFDELFVDCCFDIPVANVISVQYRCGDNYAHYIVWYKE